MASSSSSVFWGTDEHPPPNQPRSTTMNSTGTKMLAAAVAGAGLIAMLATPASAGGDKCRATVAKESANLTQAIAKILQKCDESVRAGKGTGPCPDSKSAGSIT